MTNKLRLSTAIISSLAGLGLSAAVAQTTVSGNVAMGFIATSTDATTRNGSFSSMTKETQINVGTKGKLNNGMDYAAGFSIEMDGPDASGTDMFAEGNYIEIKSGDTTLSIGADRINNPDRHVTNAVGIGYIGQDGLGAGQKAADGTGSRSIYPLHGSIYGFFGAGLVQKVGNGNLSFYYAPATGSTGVLNDIGNGANATDAAQTPATSSSSAIEIGYNGDLGVKGLTVQAFHTNGGKRAEFNTSDKEIRSTNLGVSYNVGQITLSAAHLKTEGVQGGFSQNAASNATNGGLSEELTGKSVGLAFAANKDLSFGLTYAKADTSHASATQTEKTVIASVGYSLGAVGVKAQYADVENYAGQLNNDGKAARVLVFTSF
jgi:hypothetical protein